MSVRKVRVGVLGAAGTVGQRFIQMLEKHPWFEVVALAGSERQVGREYGEVVRWQLGEDPPEYARRMILQQSEPTLECEVVFSALPSDKAAHLESRFAEAGYKVFTNAGGHRMDSDVPLMVPYINPEHLGAIPCQQQNRGWKGFILTNPNCASIPLAMALKPLHERIGVVRVLVTTMQGVSGAGYPGVPSLDILGNIVPHIEGEERKVETEPLKMLGAWGGYTFEYAPIRISAQCHRAPVRDGHLVAASVEFSQPSPSGTCSTPGWSGGPTSWEWTCRVRRLTPSCIAPSPTGRSLQRISWRRAGWEPCSDGCGRARCSAGSSTRSATTPSSARPDAHS
ncbi:MAG: aspartate-semialdehyde dehydrogenase [Chloroflexia bacterium]